MAHPRRIAPTVLVLAILLALAAAVVLVVLVIFTGCCRPGGHYGG